VDRQTAAACEAEREKIARRWLGPRAAARWAPKCQLVLHSSDESYVREIGVAGRGTLASALIDRAGGKITLRRIDVRAAKRDWLTAALAHELAHVVVADHFPGESLPRWADEGIAILADPADKQRRHRREFEAALAAGGEFRLHELVTLRDYPPAGRWGTFYGQSASLVDYLVRRSDERQFIEFVHASLEHGFERGLRHTYGMHVAQLESCLRTDALAERGDATRTPVELVHISPSNSSLGQ
jgi:hypothetical protein